MGKDIAAECTSNSFPTKLFTLLEKNNGDCIEWLPHGLGFRVKDSERFSNEIIPTYFKQTKISSFRRQLNLYGFRRVSQKGVDHGAYFHPKFQRGRIDLISSIRRAPMPKPYEQGLNHRHGSANGDSNNNDGYAANGLIGADFVSMALPLPGVDTVTGVQIGKKQKKRKASQISEGYTYGMVGSDFPSDLRSTAGVPVSIPASLSVAHTVSSKPSSRTSSAKVERGSVVGHTYIGLSHMPQGFPTTMSKLSVNVGFVNDDGKTLGPSIVKLSQPTAPYPGIAAPPILNSSANHIRLSSVSLPSLDSTDSFLNLTDGGITDYDSIDSKERKDMAVFTNRTRCVQHVDSAFSFTHKEDEYAVGAGDNASTDIYGRVNLYDLPGMLQDSGRGDKSGWMYSYETTVANEAAACGGPQTAAVSGGNRNSSPTFLSAEDELDYREFVSLLREEY